MRRADLISVVSVLDVDEVLERAVAVGAARTGAGAAVVAVLDGHAEPHVTTRGTDVARAVGLRARLGDTGLPGTPGERPDDGLARLRDPADGTEVLRVPVVVGDRLFADLLLLDPPPDGFADVDVSSISVLGKVTGVAVRNALSYHFNEKRREAAELAAAVDQSLRPPFLLAEPLNRIADGALRLSGARTAAVVAASEATEVRATAGEAGDGLVRLLDEVADRVREAGADGHEFVVRVDGRPVWGLPLSPEHAFAGVVVLVLDRARAHPSAEDRELLASFVRHGSLVLDRGVLQQERQHAVLAADRDRIARDLHDVVIQRLYATALRLRAGAREEGGGDEHVTEAIREIGDSIREIRGTIFELERGRSASLRSDVLGLAREYEPALGFVPVVRTWGPVDSLVGQDLTEQVTVVLRELLSNCARHADAGRCEIDLAVEPGWFSLQVSDDGRGMPDGEVVASGLRNIRARATALGGDLVVEPGDPRGTRLRWRVPLEPQGPSTGSSGAGTASPVPGSVAGSA